MKEPIEDTLLMDLFREEVAMHADQITDCLVKLEFSGADDELFESLMRAAHSLKGASRVVALDEVTSLAHLLEDCFVNAHKTGKAPDAEKIDIILQVVDWIKMLSVQEETALPGWIAGQHAKYMTLKSGLMQADAIPELKPEPAYETPPAAQVTPSLPQGTEISASLPQAVKVNTDVLNQFLGLASESLVEAHRFEHILQHLDHLRKYHQSMDLVLTRAEQSLQLLTSHERDYFSTQLLALRTLIDKSRQRLMTDLRDLRGFAQRNTLIADRFFAEAIESRMRPIEDACSALPRMIRDVSRTLGKKAVFELHGGQTQVDRDILSKLEAPLGHLIRNALDHGIELPEQRERIGKSAVGLIRLQVRHHGGRLMLVLDDDGAGIDQTVIKAKILEKGLATEDMLKAMSDDEVFAFLFLPGFTTRESVTDVSGRGVGLDAVQTMVHAEGGQLSVSARMGGGTRFTLILPVTRSVVRALLVRLHDEIYAFPLGRVERVLRVDQHHVKNLEGRCYISFENRNLALIKAEEMLGFSHGKVNPDEAKDDDVSVVVLSEGQEAYAMEVSAFIGESELVVRPMDARLGKVPFINAISTTEDGDLVLILETDDLIRAMAGELTGGRNLGMQSDRVAMAVRPRRILVVDDSVTVRELERRLLEKHGYEVDVAVDGADGLNALRTHDYQLVISDVDMPRMNGLELVKKLRNDPRLSELPVIIVSYKEREEDRKLGDEAGANVYLSKTGFKDDRLVHAVRQLIGEAVPEEHNHENKDSAE